MNARINVVVPIEVSGSGAWTMDHKAVVKVVFFRLPFESEFNRFLEHSGYFYGFYC